MLTRASKKHNTSHVTVSRDLKTARLGKARVGQDDKGVCISFDDISKVFDFAAEDSYFKVGDLIVKTHHGWPMGGEESEECCGVDMHAV